ncbi:MAG: hypothetical protein FJY98_03710 [Candidatus Liptonbacteria bacterium]|nr:hypothetical protein [Candidatus Liptonbacteria bacterium]
MVQKYTLGILTLFILGLATVEPQTAFTLRRGLQGSASETGEGAAQVLVLETQLARDALILEQLASSTLLGTVAEVYSEYPFGLKSELLVNVGKEKGVLVGQPVLFRGIFIGRVTKVFPHFSLVETLFDVRTKYPVRVGKKGVDALLVGGGEPRLTLVSNDAVFEPGEAVYAAIPSLPYGMPIGAVGTMSVARDGLFKEAQMIFPFNPTEVRVLRIRTDWDPALHKTES